ncbi:2-keto-4-pentenoate hydratase [Lichenicoccus sp.]|uniref:2-keto-4-pentenoate hydratase n=1 Tax=Lichenicoccus sp. TaxID=2781899 RepID=UPI003D13A1AD
MTSPGVGGPADRLAAMLVQAIATGVPVGGAGMPAIEAERDAYRVQALVTEALGPVVGWKVGRKSPQAAPTCAPLFASRMNPSGGTIGRDAFRLWRLEAELAFRLARDLPPVGKPRGRDEVLAAVGEVLAVFEIVDSRYAAWPDMAPAMLLADLQSHGAMVIGSSIPMPAASALKTVHARLDVNGIRVVDAGSNPAGDIIELLVWLANQPAPGGRSLRAGDLVTTGSFTGLVTLPPGGHAEARLSGVGTVAVTRGQ